MPKKTVKKENKDSFEVKLRKLEEIAAKLDSEDIGIENAIILYEEGIKLSKECIETLKNAELKITELKTKLTDITESQEELFEEQ
jgi:exodeoxyribonuclease VII small subunit